MGTLKYTYPLTVPSETLEGLAAALSKNNRNFQDFLNSTVIRKESDGTVNLPASSTVATVLISTVTGLHSLSDVTLTLPTTKHFLAHNGAGQFVNRVLVSADLSDMLDEDDMASDSNVKTATQQSIKKYIDDQIASHSH